MYIKHLRTLLVSFYHIHTYAPQLNNAHIHQATMTSTSQDQADLELIALPSKPTGGQWCCRHPKCPGQLRPESELKWVRNDPHHEECWRCQNNPTATSDSPKRVVNSSSDEGYKADEEKEKKKGKGKTEKEESDSDRDIGTEAEKGKGKRAKDESDSDKDVKRPKHTKHISNLEKLQDNTFYEKNWGDSGEVMGNRRGR